MKMRKYIYILIGILVFIVLVVAIFLFSKILSEEKFVINNFEISMSNEDAKDLFKNLGPTKDENSDIVPQYKFKIVNTDSYDSSYNLLIEDIINNDEEQNYLSRKILHYELQLNDIVVKKGILSEIKNNIIDTRTMSKGSTNKYALRIWIGENVKEEEWMNKYYSYNILVEPIKE